ncbi:MAG: trypsin-like peptidase domain-containing protein [Myxococcales bacterium]|nr:trypsin-like peptidase domain-containing protein [Myxococcales bacterium]
MTRDEELKWLQETIEADENEESIRDWLNDKLALLHQANQVPSGDVDFYVRSVRLLRSGRFFHSLDLLAQAVHKKGGWALRLVVDWSQALIYLGRFTAAIELLMPIRNELMAKPDKTPLETKMLPEVLGHLGRAYKDLAIWARPNAIEPRLDDLQRSIDYYRQGYDLDPNKHYWHGVNLVAVAAYRNRILGNTELLSKTDKELAEQLFGVVNQQIDDQRDEGKSVEFWALATRGELHVALGRYEDAANDYHGFASLCADRFAPASAARQLQQLWGLHENTPPGYQILPSLHNRSFELGGPVGVQLQASVGLEAMFGPDRFVGLEWWKRFLDLSNGVVRIRDKALEHWLGTGFLVSGESVWEPWKGKTLLVTCNHVVYGCEPKPPSARPNAISVEQAGYWLLFSDPENKTLSETLEVAPNPLFTSDANDLDVTILEVTRPVSASKTLVASDSSVRPGLKTKLYIMGYVGDPELKVSFDDNVLLDVKPQGWLCYRTPTIGGFSGGPVFDRALKVVAVHSRADYIGSYNMGMSIEMIRSRLSQSR